MKNQVKRILKDRIENGLKKNGKFTIRRYNAPFDERYYPARYQADKTMKDLLEMVFDYQDTLKEDTWEHEECYGLIHRSVEELIKEYKTRTIKDEEMEVIIFRKNSFMFLDEMFGELKKGGL